ncbi:hypothetical protein F4677DRAFT_74855 [Hypoxylon crocopeplum]|nr:hypothetical protein F4677DRAFT_74855 [Hypoxylon crocopeplum]
MPMEEMEITTDFGHTGFGEDIDIDLDFAVAQPDEDLELADFDQAQEMHNFNSDTRDELMAEGDDASYGMIDADDVDHNEAATVANDIEIDLGDHDVNLWQQDVPHDETFENVEIDYVENTDLGNANAAENVGSNEGTWLDASAIDTTGNKAPHDSAAGTSSVDYQDFGVFETGGVDAEDFGVDGADVNDNGPENAVQSTVDEHQDAAFDADFQQPAEESAIGEQGELENNQSARSEGAASHGENTHDSDEDVRRLASHYEASETGYGQGDDTFEEEAPASVASNRESVGEHLFEQDLAEQHGSSNSEASEHQLGGDSYAESTNDQEPVDQDTTQEGNLAPDADETHDWSKASDPGDEDYEAADINKEEQTSQTGAALVEHPLSIATRYEMFIYYGRADYRLFAKSEDDDPNQYFLSDMSALELPLSQFLSSLRDVIADEVSPLNELVMHVDGLGLEFSESSTSDMLEKYTFGDILGLYDRLVKNDGADSPALYTYLMVRPNCRQRLMALSDSANSGRGLSEIAVYREATPFDDEHAGELNSQAQSDSSPGEDEETYEYEEDHLLENGADENENVGEIEDGAEPNPPSVHNSVAEVNTNDLVENTEKSEEKTGENAIADVDGNTADDLIDFSDDELDLSSAKQGNAHSSLPSSSSFSRCRQNNDCQCDACFELELERLDASWRLDSTTFVPSGNTVETQHAGDSNQHSQDQSSVHRQTTSPTEQPFSFPELRSFGALRIITNLPLHQDQQANASLRDYAHETREEAGVVITAESSSPNQHTSPTNRPVDVPDAPNSDITSATATLTGDDKDEIDYSDDDGEEIAGGIDAPSNSDLGAPASLQVPNDDEITWESENEDAKDEPKPAPKDTVQASPTSGKRPRSDSDSTGTSDQQNGVKRRRSS